jgi:hypothetical protein
LALLAVLPLLPASARHPSACRIFVVARAGVSHADATTIQAAVDQARTCDSILIAPGVYREAVVIRTPHLLLRGLDRNRVVLDGGHRVGSGIRIIGANDVSIENLTVRNFDRASLNDDEHGAQIWWQRVQGWHGSYLTVYETGLLGGYGLYALRAQRGRWDHVYASGFNDSGLYIGACRSCLATVSHAVAERNAVGYAGSNSGGDLVVEDSLFRDNAIGLTANSTESDPPPPQLGSCAAGANRNATPTISSPQSHAARSRVRVSLSAAGAPTRGAVPAVGEPLRPQSDQRIEARHRTRRRALRLAEVDRQLLLSEPLLDVATP